MTYTDYITYFKNVAINHLAILHTAAEKKFYRIDLQDFIESVKDVAAWPSLGLEQPFIQTTGSTGALRKITSGALIIFDLCADPLDHNQQEAAYANCYQIIEDIRAKMVNDARNYNETKKEYDLPYLQTDSFGVEAVPPGYLNLGFVGVRLNFAFSTPAENFDATKWNNETDYVP